MSKYLVIFLSIKMAQPGENFPGDKDQGGAKVAVSDAGLDRFDRFFCGDPLDDEGVDFEGRPRIAFPFDVVEERLDRFDRDVAYAFYFDVSV